MIGESRNAMAFRKASVVPKSTILSIALRRLWLAVMDGEAFGLSVSRLATEYVESGGAGDRLVH
jgi:hypothetical protein